MTKEEILAMEAGEVLAMEAGEELSKRVTEGVFGEHWHYSIVGYSRYDMHCQKCGSYDYKNKPYSTDISAAWQVKERLNGEGLLLTLVDLCPTSGDLCRAEFWDNMGLVPSRIVGRAEAEFAPEAICKAALLARLEASND